jgi:hypothetical protein
METFMYPMAAIYLLFLLGRLCWLVVRAISALILSHRNTFFRATKNVKKLRHVHHK